MHFFTKTTSVRYPIDSLYLHAVYMSFQLWRHIACVLRSGLDIYKLLYYTRVFPIMNWFKKNLFRISWKIKIHWTTHHGNKNNAVSFVKKGLFNDSSTSWKCGTIHFFPQHCTYECWNNKLYVTNLAGWQFVINLISTWCFAPYVS